MPIQSCSSNSKPGFKWGTSGKCYIYTPKNPQSKSRARNKARKQGIAQIINTFEFEIVADSVASSSNVKSYSYNTQTFELYITFQDNSTYLYQNVSLQDFLNIKSGAAVCITSGSNRFGSWFVGKTPSVGAAVYEYLVLANKPYQKVSGIFGFEDLKQLPPIASFDYDGVLSTDEGKELAKKKASEGYEIHIVTARMESGDNESLFNVAKELGIAKENIHFTNHKDKWETIQNIGASLHYDNNQEQVDKVNANTAVKAIKLQESYNDYPQIVVDNAKRALKWVEENGWGSCGTPVGKIRANQLAKGESISRDTIARMAAFARHLQYDNKKLGDGCAKLMILAWGGREGIEWAQRKLKQIDKK